MISVEETTDLSTCLALRRVVFVEEQGVSLADEVDGRDGDALHFLAREGDAALGTARMLVEGGTGKIGRVCVLQAARRRGLGKALIGAAVRKARDLGLARVKLGAQLHALAFYEGLGFVANGPVYDDAGMDHRDMVLDLA